VRAIEARPGIFAAAPGFPVSGTDNHRILEKKPASAAGKGFREEAL
jgi:hypothetical protein